MTVRTDKHIYAEIITTEISLMCRCGKVKGLYDCDDTEWQCPDCGQLWSIKVIIEPIQDKDDNA